MFNYFYNNNDIFHFINENDFREYTYFFLIQIKHLQNYGDRE